MVQAEWLDLPSMHGGIRLDAHVVMPNHFHGILVLPGIRRDGLDDLLLPGEAGPSLASVPGRFKSRTSRRARRCHALPLRSLWQRGYFEHIIRDERAFLAIRQYIADNAKTWANDVLNPEHPRHWMFRR